MQTAPPLTPAECLGYIFRGLTRVLDTLSMYGPFPRPLAQLIFTRIIEINRRFRRLAERIAAGTFVQRRYHGRKPAADPKPRQKSPLPTKFGWLLPLVPEAVQFRAQLEHLLQDPATIALLQAAPAPMARILRPLCWMLFLTPPPILARPNKPRPPAKAKPARPKPTPPPQPPEWVRTMPRSAQWPGPRQRRLPPPRSCGPPLKA